MEPSCLRVQRFGMAPPGLCLPFDLIVCEPPLLALMEMQTSAELPGTLHNSVVKQH